MHRPIGRRPKTQLEATSLIVECLADAESPGDAFHRFASLVGSWLSSGLFLVQVRGYDGTDRFFSFGPPVSVRALGEGDLRQGKAVTALASGRLVVTNQLKARPAFVEDAALVLLGMQSGIRAVIRSGQVELGRFGCFAESPGHFTPPRRRLVEWLLTPLAVLCRYTAQVGAHDPAAAPLALDDWALVPPDLLSGLRICREGLDRNISPPGSLVVLLGEGDPPTVLVEQAGRPMAGVPRDGPPERWQAWLEGLPASGRLEQGVWAAPVRLDEQSVGALAIGVGESQEPSEVWRTRTESSRSYLAALAAQMDAIRRTEALGRFQVSTLAAGLADEVKNLATELALQVELLQDSEAQMTGVRFRQEAMLRLVQKGASLAERLEGLAQGPPEAPADGRVPLGEMVDAATVGLRAYRGGRDLQVDTALGRFDRTPVPAELHKVLHCLFVVLAEHRAGGARVLVRAHADPGRGSFLTLWIGEQGGETALWNEPLRAALETVRQLAQGTGGDLSHMVLEPGTQVLTLKIPIMSV